MDEETECRSMYELLGDFFLINHGNTHHSDTYTHYILASR